MLQTSIPLDKFKEELSLYTGLIPYRLLYTPHWLTLLPPPELSSVALGAKISSVSDEFFAEAFNLLKVEVIYHLHKCFLSHIHVCSAGTKLERVVWTQRCFVFWLGK